VDLLALAEVRPEALAEAAGVVGDDGVGACRIVSVER
jgi:hypothetical protein